MLPAFKLSSRRTFIVLGKRTVLASLLIFLASVSNSARAQSQAAGGDGAALSSLNGNRVAIPQATTAQSFSTVAMTTSMEVLNDSAKLGVGDKVSYRVVEEKHEPITLTVTDSGEMEVPLIGRVPALNKSCKQLAYEIKPLLEKEYFYSATVIVGLDSLSTKSRGKVYLTGQVRTQGALDLMPDEEMTVSKAILRAGGLADFANRRKVKIVRKKPTGETETIVVDLAAVIDKGKLDKDPVLEPGDMIVVPERLINF